ncbi:MAG TPA: zinc ribbon domain-containing protein [Anaerolineae bacterium]|nr:zinc ribbon domain-containing protein [Anaerolineae bacterium]
MKSSRSITTILLVTLFLAFFLGSASAQEPVELQWLLIKFWPEYDDPSLLVIIDGELATPGSELRIPLPADAELNAVATAESSGRLLVNDWREETTADGKRILVFSPQFPVFRVEYYTPLAINGDQRIVDFELPAGYLSTNEANIEALLPPSSKDIELDPPADEQGPTQDEVHLFQRTVGEVKDQAIRQKITYVNASGALTVPETASSSGALLQPTPPPAEETQDKTATGITGNPWILLLGVAALLLIVGGAVGLWLTRETDENEALPAASPAPKIKRKKRSASTTIRASQSNLDRYCRNCGREFGPDDRYCRYCGAKRQTVP